MPFNEQTANRVREIIAATHDSVEEKKMFSGMCFMVNDKMCVCLNDERMMFRIDPEQMDALAGKDGAQPMVMKGKPMKGYIEVSLEMLGTKKKLEYWVTQALDYNQFAKASKKKPKK